MDKQRKKELLQQYKEQRPDMGIYGITIKKSGVTYMACTKDLKASKNRDLCQLNFGSHPNTALQKAWKELGESAFECKTIEILEYDKKNPDKTDYKEELQILLTLCKDKLKNTEVIRP